MEWCLCWAITVRSRKFSVLAPARCAHSGKLSTQTRNLPAQCQFEGAFECDQRRVGLGECVCRGVGVRVCVRVRICLFGPTIANW